MSSSVFKSKSACTVCGRWPQNGSFTITVTGCSEPTHFKATHHTVYSEKAGLFLLPAALLFLSGALVPALLWRRLP